MVKANNMEGISLFQQVNYSSNTCNKLDLVILAIHDDIINILSLLKLMLVIVVKLFNR